MKKVPQKKEPSSPPPSSGPISRQMRIYLACLFLLIFLAASLLVLAKLRQSVGDEAPVLVQLEQPSETLILEDMQVEIESTLLRGGYGSAGISAQQQGGALHWRIGAEFPPKPLVSQLSHRLQRISTQIELLGDPKQGRLSLRWKGRETHRLDFVPPEEPLPVAIPPAELALPRIAIVLDDLGRDLESARRLVALEIPVTFAVMPNTERSREVATLAHRAGREVMIHIPMEPRSYPKADPGENALFTRLSSPQIRSLFMGYLDRVPFAVGGNNHMGSRFTENVSGMTTVLQVMSEQGLYFVDSRTTSQSVARKSAAAVGVPFATRDIFLDNDRDVELIRAQLVKLVEKALKNGQALGIGHPYPETLRALEIEAPLFAAMGVQVVSASALLSRED